MTIIQIKKEILKLAKKIKYTTVFGETKNGMFSYTLIPHNAGAKFWEFGSEMEAANHCLENLRIRTGEN